MSNFDHLIPNNRTALNDLLTRAQSTMSKLRGERRRLARENALLRERLRDADPDACIPCARCGSCETHDCGGCATREELTAMGYTDEELDDHFGTERTLADAIASTVGTSSAEVRRTMYAGGVIHDGEQIRDPEALAKYYEGQTVIYGRRSSPVKIEPEVEA